MTIFRKIGVVGAGIMGAGIAQRCATFGYHVLLVDMKEECLQSARERIVRSIDKLIEKAVLSRELLSGALPLIDFVTDFATVSSCDLVIEAVNENPDLKKKIFSDLDRTCSAQTILASNTSSIPIASLASVTQRPQRVLGLHFMNPVPIIPLVEMIRIDQTSDKVFEDCANFVKSVRCECVESKDSPGFIINRILIPMINEAARVLESGTATAEDIDRAMVLGTKQPMGPLALADLIGLDTVVDILHMLHSGFNDERYHPSPLLEENIRRNRLGRKTGCGFFEYTDRVETTDCLK